MDSQHLIKELRERIKQVDAEIDNCKQRIRDAGYPNEYESVLKELINDRRGLADKIDNIKHENVNMLEQITISIEHLYHKLLEIIRKTSETITVKSTDKKTIEDYLEKHDQTISEYSIAINIIKLEQTGKQLIAERTITIRNKVTGKTREYQAGQSAKQLWYVIFDEDLSSGKFNNA